VKFIPLDANERFKELQSRETSYDLCFPAVAYYDGQGFLWAGTPCLYTCLYTSIIAGLIHIN